MNAPLLNGQVAVIGAGTMGIGIAQVAAAAGHPVRLFDIAPNAAQRALDELARRLRQRVDGGKADANATEVLLARLERADSLEQLADCALVIEAVAENLAIKQSLFRDLEAVCSPTALFASNTSSLSITAIAGALQHPARMAGLHFFNPAPLMKLVEIVSGLETGAETLAALQALAQRWGKQSVVCRSTPGFIVNRVARPFYAETLRALEERVADAATLDAVMRDAGGFAMGPLQLTDLIGQDVNYAVTDSVYQAFYQDPRFTLAGAAGAGGRRTSRPQIRPRLLPLRRATPRRRDDRLCAAGAGRAAATRHAARRLVFAGRFGGTVDRKCGGDQTTWPDQPVPHDRRRYTDVNQW